MPSFELAQLNIALLQAPIDSPQLEAFVENLDRINALAEGSPGFVWRLQGDDGNATSVGPFGEDHVVNLSVWKDIRSLHDFVYKSGHVEVMRHRREWFEPVRNAYMVLWWVPEGHRPTVEEAKAKLETLQREGPSEKAFTFKRPYPAPNAAGDALSGPFDDICPAT